jgi:hypothetical protein
MDHLFFSWLATQPYSIEVAVGAIFVVIIAPAVLAGMAALATWAERLIGELVRISGLLNPLEREKMNLWRLQTPLRSHRLAAEQPAAQPREHGSRAAG